MKNKNVLICGFGPSGLAVTQWLLDQGANITITDRRDTKVLASSVRRIEERIKKLSRDGKDYAKRQAQLVWALGNEKLSLVNKADLVVADSALPAMHPLLRRAASRQVPITNEASLLFRQRKDRRVVALTGAHGKTTAALWAAHLTGYAIVAGHAPDHVLASVLGDVRKTVIAELSASVLESCEPRPMLLVSTDEDVLPAQASGTAFANAGVDLSIFQNEWGMHNSSNLAAAIRAARALKVPFDRIRPRISSLPQLSERQEIIHRSGKLTIVDDGMATAPERGMAAVARFGGPSCILIAGGSGRRSFTAWAAMVREQIRPTNLVLVSGTATRAMREALGEWGKGIRAYDTLNGALGAAMARAGMHMHATVVFSPAATVAESFGDAVRRVI